MVSIISWLLVCVVSECPFKSADKSTKYIKDESHVSSVITMMLPGYNEVTKFIETYSTAAA